MDRGELETLVKAHQGGIFRYLRYLGARSAVAEDLVQETFLAAFRARRSPDLHDDRATAAWLRAVARNLFLTHCRRSRANPVKVTEAFLEGAERVWASEFLRTGDGFDYVEALRACLETLSDKPRRTLALRYAEDRSRTEMAELLSMTENGVKSLLQRIRTSLAECVAKRLKPQER